MTGRISLLVRRTRSWRTFLVEVATQMLERSFSIKCSLSPQHRKYRSFSGKERTRLGPGSTMEIAEVPPATERKAICWPSGDQTGGVWQAGQVAKLVRPWM